MKNDKKNQLMHTFSTILIILSILLFVSSCIIRRYENGNGVICFIAALSLLAAGAILWAEESRFLFCFFAFWIYILVFSLIENHLQPTVTQSIKICANMPEPKLLLDDRVYCSPIEGDTFCFVTISHDSVIRRHDRCIHCARSYDSHYPQQTSLEYRKSMVYDKRYPVDLASR